MWMPARLPETVNNHEKRVFLAWIKKGNFRILVQMFGVSMSDDRTWTSRWFVATIADPKLEMGDHISRLHHRLTSQQEEAWLSCGVRGKIEQNCSLYTCEIHLQNCGNCRHIYEGNIPAARDTLGGNLWQGCKIHIHILENPLLWFGYLDSIVRLTIHIRMAK